MSDKYIMYDPAEFDKIEIKPAENSDEITRLRADLAAVTAERDRILISAEIDGGLADECRSCGCQHESWKAHYAAITAERDRLREAFEKAANDMRPMLRSMISRNEAEEIVRRAARAAIESVTEPPTGDSNA